MMALNLMAQAAIMAVVALGAWTAMGDGMILGWWSKFWSHTTTTRESYIDVNGSEVVVKQVTTPRFPHWLSSPLATCPRCMCSAWGITALLVCGFGVGISWNFELSMLSLYWPRIAQIPVLILAAVGVQEMLHKP
jgi:hypothetical protein